MRRIRRVLALVALAGLVAGCSDVSPGVGSGPTDPPAPRYPYVELAEYEFTLEIHCFCPSSGTPIRVTVEDGVAVDGVYLDSGERSEDYTWLTLNDVIASANDTEAYSVSVSWPPCQQWPDHVSVDPERNTIDEEYGYSVADVVVPDVVVPGGPAPGCAPTR